MVKSQRASVKNGKASSALAASGGRGKSKPGPLRKSKKAMQPSDTAATTVASDVNTNGISAASDQTGLPGRRSARLASRTQHNFSDGPKKSSQSRRVGTHCHTRCGIMFVAHTDWFYLTHRFACPQLPCGWLAYISVQNDNSMKLLLLFDAKVNFAPYCLQNPLLPVSTPGVAKKSAKTTKHSASKGKPGRLSASGIWQAIQSAPGSVSKMLAPAMSPISNFIGSATQAVSSTFMRMRAPTPNPAAPVYLHGLQSEQVNEVVALQMKLEGKTT